MVKSIVNRINTIFTQEEIDRITFGASGDGTIDITVDAHGMTCSMLRRYLNNLICVVHTRFRLVVIHGYKHGTALKEMLAEMYHNQHVTDRFVHPDNPGRTCMVIM